VFADWVTDAAMFLHWQPAAIEAMSLADLGWYMKTIRKTLDGRKGA
jgi:hypothetical protein